ncbi:DUF3883 domain-containing protein [Parvularcula sp. IMCC14364]|uniref:DUF3883 domain-containing protein n=1 Tax=Parvularcula sp. IMCC14364 TaxID=3067902 RepID=UPI0027423C89|nr:DUF3883 domain-containing protein [Parvularcula sp. IMCC14364]
MAEDNVGRVWTDQQNDLIVADYFNMRELELTGVSFNKSAYRRNLKLLIQKSDGAIEFKHQNISAVLFKLGMQWIKGYRPRHNFQTSLIDAIERYLTAHKNIFEITREPDSGLSEVPQIYIESPPQFVPRERNDDESIIRLVRKFDPAKRDARNRKLGLLGEQYALLMERRSLNDNGRSDLANRVRWVSQEDGDGAGYDIRSFTPQGDDRLIEVKTTNGHKLTPFYLRA